MGLRAKDIMDPTILTVAADLNVLECARLMVDHGSGCAVIAGGDAPVGGIVTEHDILAKVLAVGREPANVPVGEIASTPVITCGRETPMDEVAATMAARHIRRIVVTHGDHIVGIITSRHVLAMFRRYVDELSGDIAKFEPNPPTTGI